MDETKRDKGIFAQLADAIDSVIPGGRPLSMQDDIERIDGNLHRIYTDFNNLQVDVRTLTRRIYALEQRLKAFAALEERIATLEVRLKSFAALERLGIASQLGEETIARTDELVTTLEHEMQEKIDQLRENQRRALEAMRTEMDEYRANMAGLAE